MGSVGGTSWQATLRIINAGQRHEEIAAQLDCIPTGEHWKGEIIRHRFPSGRQGAFAEDMWLLDAPGHELTSLPEQLAWICSKLVTHRRFLSDIRTHGGVLDVRSCCKLRDDAADFTMDTSQLQIFVALNVAVTVLIIKSTA